MSDEPKSAAKVGQERSHALDQVFDLFETQWPKAFATDKRERLRRVWRLALGNVPTDLLVSAATRFLAKVGGKYAPDAPTFAYYASELTRRHADVTKPAGPWAPRRFWYEKVGAPDGFGRVDSERAVATEVRGGGWSGISDREMDDLHAGTRQWGWL